MLISFVIALLFLSARLYTLAPHVPATPKGVTHLTEMESYLQRLVEAGNPPGISVAVVKDGEVVYNKAFGFADGPRKVKATPDTVYHWWSMTKIPTTIAIVQLQEQGKLSLDYQVTKHLPWFEVKDNSGARAAITIRNLLQHTSGLPDTIPAMIGWVHYDDSIHVQANILKKHLPEFDTLKFEPDTRAVYSNLNFMVLGAIIEAVSGQRYEDFVQTHILQPLKMSQTGFVVLPAAGDHEAAGTLPVVHFFTPLLPALLDTKALVREREGKLLWLNRVYIDATPPTGLIGSASDVGRLLLAILNGGALDGERILLPGSVSMLMETPPFDGRGLGCATSITRKWNLLPAKFVVSRLNKINLDPWTG